MFQDDVCMERGSPGVSLNSPWRGSVLFRTVQTTTVVERPNTVKGVGAEKVPQISVKRGLLRRALWLTEKKHIIFYRTDRVKVKHLLVIK
jgi:hypothetical protein